ncbi:hypothetical protein LguiA_008183 [Lonicera macranthoides]
MPERTVVDSNLMISGYWNWGNEVEARGLFHMIPKRNAITSNAMVKDLETARRLLRKYSPVLNWSALENHDALLICCIHNKLSTDNAKE